jgi:hypothetical protein
VASSDPEQGLTRFTGFSSTPLAGLTDVDDVVVASDSSPPNSCESMAELGTSLGAMDPWVDGFKYGSVSVRQRLGM